MVRVAVLYDEDTQDEYEMEVTLADGADWSNCVLDDMENANWHSARGAFEPLIHLLPEIYEALDSRLRKRLQNAVDAWDSEF